MTEIHVIRESNAVAPLTFQKMTDVAMSKNWAATFFRFKFREIKDFAESKDGWHESDVILRRWQGLYRPQKSIRTYKTDC